MTKYTTLCFLLAFSVLIAGSAGAVTEINNCTVVNTTTGDSVYTINTWGSYVITQDLPLCFVEFKNTPVSLDGNGHTVRNVAFLMHEGYAEGVIEITNLTARGIYLQSYYGPRMYTRIFNVTSSISVSWFFFGIMENNNISSIGLLGNEAFIINNNTIGQIQLRSSRFSSITNNTLTEYSVVFMDDFSSNVSSNNRVYNNVFKPSSPVAYYRNLGSDPSVVDTTDLLKAADDWSHDVTVPGFGRTIATTELLSLADEWSKSG